MTYFFTRLKLVFLFLPSLPDRLLLTHLLNPADRFWILFYLTSSQTTALNHRIDTTNYY